MKGGKYWFVMVSVLLSVVCFSSAFALGGNFQLTDQRGQAFELSDHKGKVVAMVFGHGDCTNSCLDTFVTISDAVNKLENPEDVQVVFIALDSSLNAPEKLEALLAQFNQHNIIGLTGSEAELEKAADKWNVQLPKAEKLGSSAPLVGHSSDIYVLDRAGNAHGVVRFNVSSNHLAKILHSASTVGKTPVKPAVGLVNMSGQTVDVFAQNSKATVLHFWATWCVPCREEFSDLEAAKANIDALPLDFYAISLGDEPEQINDFLKEYPLSYSILSDRTGYSGDHWQVSSLPMTVVLSPDGQEVARLRGMQPWGDADFIEKLRQVVQR